MAHGNLPEDFVSAVSRSRAFPAAGSATCVVQHASLLAHVLLSPVSAEYVLEVRRSLNQRYSLMLDGFIAFCGGAQAELRSECGAYPLAPPPVVDCGQLLEAARIQYQAAACDAALDLGSIVELFEVQRP